MTSHQDGEAKCCYTKCRDWVYMCRSSVCQSRTVIVTWARLSKAAVSSCAFHSRMSLSPASPKAQAVRWPRPMLPLGQKVGWGWDETGVEKRAFEKGCRERRRKKQCQVSDNQIPNSPNRRRKGTPRRSSCGRFHASTRDGKGMRTSSIEKEREAERGTLT